MPPEGGKQYENCPNFVMNSFVLWRHVISVFRKKVLQKQMVLTANWRIHEWKDQLVKNCINKFFLDHGYFGPVLFSAPVQRYVQKHFRTDGEKFLLILSSCKAQERLNFSQGCQDLGSKTFSGLDHKYEMIAKIYDNKW